MLLDMDELLHGLNAMKKKYNEDRGIVKKLEEIREEQQKTLDELDVTQTQLEMEKLLLQDAATEARKSATEVLQSMASQALQYIIGEEISLSIRLDEKGNTPTADFFVHIQYGSTKIETDPAEEEGGGIADIVAFSTLIAMLQLTGKGNVAPIFLDEPSKYVSKGYSEQVAKFLYDVSHSFDRQVFMVTHDEYLSKSGDMSYRFQLNEDGQTTATKL